jgi:hypothetical protein
MKTIREDHEIDGEWFAFELSWMDCRADTERPGVAGWHAYDPPSEPLFIDVKCAETMDAPPSVLFRAEDDEAEVTSDFAKAALLFKVAVKWDHCAHWEFAPTHTDRGDGYIHTCGDSPTLMRAMAKAYDLAKQIMIDRGTWDK